MADGNIPDSLLELAKFMLVWADGRNRAEEEVLFTLLTPTDIL